MGLLWPWLKLNNPGREGSLVLADAIWKNAGEISENSNHRIRGTVRFQDGLDKHLVLSNSTLTTLIPVRVRDTHKRLLKGVIVELTRNGQTLRARTDAPVTATFTLVFDGSNLRQPFTFPAIGKTKVTKSSRRSISFFTDTPIELRTIG